MSVQKISFLTLLFLNIGLIGGIVTSTIFYVSCGISIIILGFGHLLNPEFARKLLVRRNFGREWEPSPGAERIGLTIIRFILGPILITVGFALLFKFIP
jgi:hypothetical protein